MIRTKGALALNPLLLNRMGDSAFQPCKGPFKEFIGYASLQVGCGSVRLQGSEGSKGSFLVLPVGLRDGVSLGLFWGFGLRAQGDDSRLGNLGHVALNPKP